MSEDALTASLRAQLVRREAASAERKREQREVLDLPNPVAAAQNVGERQVVFARPAPVVERVVPRWQRALAEAEERELRFRRRVEAVMEKKTGSVVEHGSKE